MMRPIKCLLIQSGVITSLACGLLHAEEKTPPLSAAKAHVKTLEASQSTAGAIADSSESPAPVASVVPAESPAGSSLASEPSEKKPTVQPENLAVAAEETKKEERAITDQDISKLSQAFGNFIGKNLKNPAMSFDLESLIIGIREGAEGKPSPLNEEEYEELLALVQETSFDRLSSENLKKANAFLAENAKIKNIVELEDGKLQYEILDKGTGEVVKEHSAPQLFYTGRFIDGTVFGSSEGMESPITIPLDQTILGFGKGLVGMKEGERRRLYVHPDLAYGTNGQLPPNELLIFDIEIVHANSAPAMVSEEGDDEVEVQEIVIGEFDEEKSESPETQEATKAHQATVQESPAKADHDTAESSHTPLTSEEKGAASEPQDAQDEPKLTERQETVEVLQS